MKRFATCCVLLTALALLMATTFEATAQNIKVKTVGRSLNSMTAPVKGATAPAWNISTGLRAVGVGARTWFKLDTLGSGATGSISWTLSKPANSAAVLDSGAGAWYNAVKTDSVGQYIVTATVGTKSASDTVYAGKYVGVGTGTDAGCVCHGPAATAIKTSWQKTGHAMIFFEGMTGRLEIERGKGAYGKSCIKCHTTGWDDAAKNNNFGIVSKTIGWDTLWYKGLEVYGGDYWTTTGDSTNWKALTPTQQALGTIGCESCHGALSGHTDFTSLLPRKQTVGKTMEQDLCNMCHDASRKHSLGTFYNVSLHEKLPTGTPTEGGRSSCQPCHTGKGFLYYMDHNMDTTGIAAAWNLATDAGTSISCMVCHDPHGNDNPAYLRTVKIKGDTLRNGYKIPAPYNVGPQMTCGTCHNARYSVKVRVTTTAPYYGFVNRYGPHYNNQLDMLVGSNGYQYNDTTFTGLNTHASLEGGCVKCHMQPRLHSLGSGDPTGALPNHSFSMTDTTFAGNVYKPTAVCAECHGEIEDFDQVKAFYDYDRNGKIEGAQTEVQGMLTKLKAILPQDASGNPVTSTADSLKVKNNQAAVQGIWNYYFVANDRSLGVHNTKYAVRLLYKALGWTPLWVKEIPGALPTEIALDQNYPNPFNPSTTIRFSLPTEQNVRLEVYDMTGSLVKTLLNEALRAGNKEVVWDGTNAAGGKVASGMYLYRLSAGNFVSAKKMILVK